MAYGYDQGWLSKNGSSLAPVSIPPRLETGAGDTGSGAAVTAIPHCAPNKRAPFKRAGITYGSAIMIAILWPSHPPLISSWWRTGAIVGCIYGRIVDHHRLGSGRPAIVGKTGIENCT
jgi:hypothetical protein